MKFLFVIGLLFKLRTFYMNEPYFSNKINTQLNTIDENKEGCDDRPILNIIDEKEKLILFKKFLKMQKILNTLKHQLAESKSHNLTNDHSVFQKIPLLDCKTDITGINLKKGGLMKEWYIYTDW